MGMGPTPAKLTVYQLDALLLQLRGAAAEKHDALEQESHDRQKFPLSVTQEPGLAPKLPLGPAGVDGSATVNLAFDRGNFSTQVRLANEQKARKSDKLKDSQQILATVLEELARFLPQRYIRIPAVQFLQYISAVHP